MLCVEGFGGRELVIVKHASGNNPGEGMCSWGLADQIHFLKYSINE